MPIEIDQYTPKKRVYLKSKAQIAVYLVADETKRPTKIGYALDIPARLSSMQTGNWRKLHVHFLIWTPGYPVAARIETTAHQRLKDLRLAGEWFDIPTDEATTLINGISAELYPTVRLFEHHETVEWLRKKPIDKRDHFPSI